MDNPPQISIVIPLYNEEESISFLIERLNKVVTDLAFTTEVILVDDGSNDTTPELITRTAMEDSRYQGIFLSKNHGHAIALTAGIKNSRSTEGIMILDADLQDPPELINDFYQKLKEGYDVAYGVRKKRKESFLKKFSYWFYYRLLRMVANTDIPLDSGDFSMFSRKVANIMIAMPERSRYLRGMRAWVGFKQIGVKYERAPRKAGKSKYSFGNLLALAYDGIFNFSEVPIRWIFRLGVVTLLISMVYLIILLVKRFVFGSVPEGFTTLIVAIILFSSVQLISIGIIGEYVLRIFFEVKNRPIFIIEKKIIDGEVVDG